MSRRRVPILIAGALVLAACGFQPLYGERDGSTPTENLLSRIDVPPIKDRVGQLVRIELTNRMTPTRPAPTPAFTLVVEVDESKASLAVEKDSSATRANLTISATFRLNRNSDGAELESGAVRSVNSYDILLSDFATLAAENDARRRGAKDIADGIVDRLAVFLSRNQRQLIGGPGR